MRERMDINFKVCVQCMTFNQSPFIINTLNGFTMQQTTFPFVCVIMDDNSTDGEQKVIEDYFSEHFVELYVCDNNIRKETDAYRMDFGQHKTNKNCFFAVYYLKYNQYQTPKVKMSYFIDWLASTKYIAFCEGDDYWTDSSKLQFQVFYLDSHDDYSLACHLYSTYDYEQRIMSDNPNIGVFEGRNEVSFGLDYKIWLAKTLTLVIRTAPYLEFLERSDNLRDTVMVYFALKHGKGICFNRVMGVYTKQLGGICSKKSEYENRMALYDTSKYIYEFDKDRYTKRRYYRNYMYALFYSRGKLLFNERFELLKFIQVPIYVVKELYDWMKNRLKG